MKDNFKDIREMSDSKEMYESKPHKFLGLFIYILGVSIVVAAIWMYFGEVDIVSKGIGVVRPNENISVIRSKVQGEVVENYLEEGREVKKGDILFQIGYEDLEITRLKRVEQLEEIESTLIQLGKLRDSIEQDTNLFDREEQKEYFDRYVKYQLDRQVLENDMLIGNYSEDISNTQTTINRQTYSDQISQYDKQLAELTQFRASIQSEENLFVDKHSPSALAYETYIFMLYELDKEILDRQLTYEVNMALDEVELVAKKELEDSRVALDFAENEREKLVMGTLKQIEDEIEDLTINKQVAQQELDKLIIDQGLIEVSRQQRELSVEKYQTDTLVGLYNQIEELEATYQVAKAAIPVVVKGAKIAGAAAVGTAITWTVDKVRGE